MIRAGGASILIAAALLAACQRGSGGPLDPVAGPDVRAEAGAAQVAAEGLSASITGRWSSDGAQSLRISYRNAGVAPARIAVGALKLTHASGEAALRTAVDATGTDLTDARADNDRPRVLYVLEESATHAATLDVPPGATREIDSEFTSFSNESAVTRGDRIVAAVPLGATTVSVTFSAGNPPT